MRTALESKRDAVVGEYHEQLNALVEATLSLVRGSCSRCRAQTWLPLGAKCVVIAPSGIRHILHVDAG